MAKKRKSRKDNPYAALDPRLNLKTRFDELTDISSYANKLSKEDKDWLTAFVEEEIICNFNHKGQKLNDEESMKKAYNKNNSRNRCILNREHAQGTINYLSDLDIDKEQEAFCEENENIKMSKNGKYNDYD